MSNTLAQHFTIAITYQGTNPDTFDAETVGDCVFDNLAESDLIDRLDTVVTIEEHTARPTQTDLLNIRTSYTPDDIYAVAGTDLAIVTLITTTLDYAIGRATVEDLHEAATRSRSLAVPVTRDNLAEKQNPKPLPVPAHQN